MKKIYLLLLCYLAHFQSFSQQFTIHLLPHYSSGLTVPLSYNLIKGQSFVTPELVLKNEGTLISSNGTQTANDFRNDGFGLDVMFKSTNPESGSAWAATLGFFKQNHIQVSKIPTFSYKGYELYSLVNIYRQIGIQGGLRREFGFKNNGSTGYFIQMSAMYGFDIESLNQGKWENIQAGSQSFVENGIGTSYISSNAQTTLLMVTPEIGFVFKGLIGAELSLSYQQPLGNPLSNEKISYYRGGVITGTEETNIAPKSVWLNLRIPIKVYTHQKRIPVVYRQEPPVRRTEPVPPPQRFQNICITARDKTTQKPVAGAKIILDGKTYYTDREGKAQLSDLRIGQKGAFDIQAQNYRGGYIEFEAIAQSGCQPLNVNLTFVPPPPSVIVNGKVLKKGESIALNAIQFEQSKSELLPEGKKELNMVAELMRKYPSLMIEFSGHTSSFKEDTKEDYEANVELSQDRAESCKAFIINQVRGSENRIKVIGYGPDKPLVPNTSEENRKKNRRVELKIESL
jgi:outer membrane protein OmpA-like peptidoglycan-associated protein